MSGQTTRSDSSTDTNIVDGLERLVRLKFSENSEAQRGGVAIGPRSPALDISFAGARSDRTARTGNDEPSAGAPLRGRTDRDELKRVHDSVRAVRHELEVCRLPRAAQLPSVLGLPPVAADRFDSSSSLAVPSGGIRKEAVRRPDRGSFGLAKLLVASAISVSAAWCVTTVKLHPTANEEASTPAPSKAEAAPYAAVSPSREFDPPLSGVEAGAGDSEPASAVRPIPLNPTVTAEPVENGIGGASPRVVDDSGNVPPIAETEATTGAVEADRMPPGSGGVLDPKEINGLLVRGRQYFDAGDMAAARLLFSRAANAGDATAAVAMGTTYDPAILGSRGVRGMRGDKEKARGWYAKAAELGSPEGHRLLEALQGPPEDNARND
jgi:hypothetical protein